MDLGTINRNGQQLVEKTNLQSTTHAFAKIWIIKCVLCKKQYGANSSDTHLRRCPLCDKGRPAEEFL